MGMLDRDSRQVRAKVVPNVKRETLQTAILEQIEKGSTVYTDRGVGYDNLAAQEYVHETVNHVEEYVHGQIHTQGIDNFWSLLKRGLRGTYVAVEPFHLDRYVGEQVFRYNKVVSRVFRTFVLRQHVGRLLGFGCFAPGPHGGQEQSGQAMATTSASRSICR
jgi:transposase-like protein